MIEVTGMALCDPAVARASVNHRKALAQARALRRAASRARAFREHAARAFVDYFDAELLPNCRDEERTLFPLVLASNAPAAAVTLTLAEHEWLQVMVRRLREELDGRHPERKTLESIAALLIRHIGREELELMPYVRATGGG